MKIRRIFYSSQFKRRIRKYRHLANEINKNEEIFRGNCFDPRLATHKLHGILRKYWAFSISRKLRILFEFLDKDTVAFINVGTHSIYN